MKTMLLLPLALVLTACGFHRTEIVEYREVNVVPPYTTIRVIQDPLLQVEPVDVTTTTVEYY